MIGTEALGENRMGYNVKELGLELNLSSPEAAPSLPAATSLVPAPMDPPRIASVLVAAPAASSVPVAEAMQRVRQLAV